MVIHYSQILANIINCLYKLYFVRKIFKFYKMIFLHFNYFTYELFPYFFLLKRWKVTTEHKTYTPNENTGRLTVTLAEEVVLLFTLEARTLAHLSITRSKWRINFINCKMNLFPFAIIKKNIFIFHLLFLMYYL